ncbi:endonuclease VIII [Halobacillus seohaensis]|uniref:DNA-(apurinic or apyrimidinic site) lyase n=1 Tax=Halobacillus seohaensis TaxID=447421 RepID=A0ABW2ELI3_9BACI
MPEGPEIRKAADEVERALVGQSVKEISFAFHHLQHYQERLKTASIQKVETKGKAMLIRFDNGYTIYSHNQLYGKWYVGKAYAYPETNRQLRLAIHNEKNSALLYSASDIEVLRDEEVPLHPFIAKVGPDLLNDKVSVTDLVRRFQSNRFRKRRWTSLLLDQAFIAGIGNYLRSEILFVSGIHPELRPIDCTVEQLEKAARTSIDLMWRSYQNGGITNNLELVQRLKDLGVAHDQYRYWVFNREGQPCRMDGTEIIKIMAGSRRCYYCPTCQSKEL